MPSIALASCSSCSLRTSQVCCCFKTMTSAISFLGHSLHRHFLGGFSVLLKVTSPDSTKIRVAISQPYRLAQRLSSLLLNCHHSLQLHNLFIFLFIMSLYRRDDILECNLHEGRDFM
jgi:hypothetical protein